MSQQELLFAPELDNEVQEQACKQAGRHLLKLGK